MSSNGKISPSPLVRPYQQLVPFPLRVAWSKLSKLEPKFMQFLDVLKRIYASVPFLEALKETSTYLKFLRELLSKKEEPEEV